MRKRHVEVKLMARHTFRARLLRLGGLDRVVGELCIGFGRSLHGRSSRGLAFEALSFLGTHSALLVIDVHLGFKDKRRQPMVRYCRIEQREWAYQPWAHCLRCCESLSLPNRRCSQCLCSNLQLVRQYLMRNAACQIH